MARLEPPPEHGFEATRLFEMHSEWLHRYCLRQLGSSADAADAVQTTFLYALRALQRDVVPECEEAWLTAIAKNVCRSHKRTLGRRGALASDVDLDAIAGRPTDDCDEDRLIGLQDALASLPESQRRALVLREWHGVPSHEIASQLHLSAPATHALISRGRRALARALTVPRPLAGFDLSWLLYKLEAPLRLLGIGMSKATAVTVAAGIVVGGIALERELSPPPIPKDRNPVSTVSPTGTGSKSSVTRTPLAPETLRSRISGRRSVASAAASDRAGTVPGTELPEAAPNPTREERTPEPTRTAPAPTADASPPDVPAAPPSLPEPLPTPLSPLPGVEPAAPLPPLPVPPRPDPLGELAPAPAPLAPALPLPLS